MRGSIENNEFDKNHNLVSLIIMGINFLDSVKFTVPRIRKFIVNDPTITKC